MKMTFMPVHALNHTAISASVVGNGTVLPAYLGYINLLISSAFYGLNYSPVKKFETGDGMFFQLIVCLAIWQTGLITSWIRNWPKFYALPMLGGFLWSTGNINTVPVIKLIGIGLGSLFWNASGLIVGWAYARFGWFGITPEIPANPTVNYIGVALGIVSTIALAFLKPHVDTLPERRPLMEDEEPVDTNNSDPSDNNGSSSVFDRMSKRTKQILGSCLSLFAGVMYALAYAPQLYIQSKNADASQNNLDYAFSQSTGIFLGSLFYFVVYCVFKKNKPDVFPQVVLPGLIAGWLWGIANNCYFLATNSLSQAITYPISNVGPSCFACLAGLFFREIKGLKNYFVLIVSIALAIVSSVLCGLSR